MKLLIDIGNTSAKLAVMGADIVHFERRHESWKETLVRLMAMFSIADVRISTVAGEDGELQEALAQLEVPVQWLTPSVPCRSSPFGMFLPLMEPIVGLQILVLLLRIQTTPYLS